jgi:hypothetical protein
MTTQFRDFTVTQCANDFGQQFTDQIYTATLAATTDTVLTIPGTSLMGNLPSTQNNKFMAVVRITQGLQCWMALNATAAVPAGAAFAASTSELISQYPIGKFVKAGDVLHFFAPAANTSVSVALYAVPGH